MGMPVVTVASGGLPVGDMTGTGKGGVPVTEATNKFGVAITKVTGGGGMPVVFETIGGGGGGGGGPTTFNPSDLTNVTLSGGNLVATVGSGSGGVRGTSSYSSGKYYWENTYTLINSNSFATGIVLASTSLTFVSNLGAAFIARSTGGITVNGVGSGSALGIISQGSVIGVAIDFTAKLIWFRVAPAGNWNGSGTANPATGTGGVDITSISTGPLYPIFNGQTGDKVTTNFGATAFSGSLPSGFSAWG